jgi:hypothetical protein
MTDRRLQKSYLVTGLQRPPTYNVAMSLTDNEQRTERVTSIRRAARLCRGRARTCGAGLVLAALLGTAVLVAACGGTSSGSAATRSASTAANRVLAYISCMHTHGEPNLPDPSGTGSHLHIAINPSSGVDPNSPQFTAANNACKHLISKNGSAPEANTITPADQADYLKAAACMRSHGIPDFPDPVFQGNNVAFNAPGSSIDTNSSPYKRALTTCEKLIPAGLPYSSPGNS